MQIHSNFLHAYVELDAYVNNDTNIIITHKSLVKYIQRLTEVDMIDVDYTVVKAELIHSVVMCQLRYKNSYKNIKIVELGETTKETLGKNFYNYPVITAQEQAFDRAVIKLLELPDNCYSVLEFLRNCDYQENTYSDSNTGKSNFKNNLEDSNAIVNNKGSNVQNTENNNKNKQEDQKKVDLKDFVVDYGVYAGSGLTIQEVFIQAEKDAQKKATLNLYLAKDPSQVRNQKERVCLIALQKYAKKMMEAYCINEMYK